MKYLALPAILALVITPAFAAAPKDQAATAHQDTKFLEKANQGSVDEIDLAKLVVQKTDNPDVKAFAQRMIDDHGKLLDDMKPFDNEAGLKIPEHASAAADAEKLKLDVLKGESFDKAYIKTMVEDHHNDLREFIAEKNSTGYPAFRDAVANGEKVIREHLEQINGIAKKNGIAPAPVPSGE